MSLAIVIPTKNEEEFLPRLLQSIKNQSLQPDEVIVSDAGSTDRTREIANQYQARIVEGGMPGAGRNRGGEAAESDLILFLDADVELQDKDFLKKAITEFEARGLGIATADPVPIDGSKYDIWSHNVYKSYVRFWGAKHPHAPGFCQLVRRDLFQQVGGFDETVKFCEDHDFVLRVSKIGKFGFLSNVTIPVSIRRQERDGRWSMGVKYVLAEVHIWLFGSIRHGGFNYSFGYGKKHDSAGDEKPESK